MSGQPGDTMFKIATKAGVSLDAMKEANPMENYDQLVAGQSLHLPKGASKPTFLWAGVGVLLAVGAYLLYKKK